MPDDATSYDALEELIEALEAAAEGSRALDVRIEYSLGIALRGRIDVAGLLIDEGVSWNTVSETLDHTVPPYTTRLDAAVEGENIEFVIKSAKRGRWGALQRSRHRHEVLAWGSTEPLARRLAAVKGWRADLLLERERENATEGEHASPSEHAESNDDADVEPRDWKVLF